MCVETPSEDLSFCLFSYDISSKAKGYLFGHPRGWQRLSVCVYVCVFADGNQANIEHEQCDDSPDSKWQSSGMTEYNHFFFLISFSALLSGTLRTFQRRTCDSDKVSLACPRGTSISIELAQYEKNGHGKYRSMCSHRVRTGRTQYNRSWWSGKWSK